MLNRLGYPRIASFSAKIVAFVMGVGVTLAACIGGKSNARCIPPTFPTGTAINADSYDLVTLSVNDHYEDVITFYDVLLDPTPYDDAPVPGSWSKREFDDTRMLYQCHAALNSIEVELGCI